VPLEEPGSTAIVVLTPEAEPVAGCIYRAHTDAGRDGMTPHVTLVVPFIPAACLGEDVLDRLRRCSKDSRSSTTTFGASSASTAVSYTSRLNRPVPS
jgi:hypothetical protein